MGEALINRLLKNLKIRQKIMYPLVAMVILVFFVMGISEYKQMKLDAEVYLQDKLESTSHLANVVLSNALWNYNDELISNLSDALMQDNEIVFMSIRTKSGVVFFEKTAVIHAKNPELTSLMDQEIFYDKKSIGIVRIGVTSLIQQESLYDEMVKRLTSLMAIILSMSLMILFISRYVTKPIERLEKGADAIAKGQIGEKIELISHDEIGRLANKFNDMSESLATLIKALDVSKEKYSKAFKNLSEVIGLLHRTDTIFVEVNDAFYNVLGYSLDEVVGRSSLDFKLWVDEQERVDFYEIMNREGRVTNWECRWLTKSRELRIGLVSAELITIDQEEYELFVWNDITIMKKNEQIILNGQKILEEKIEERTNELKLANEQLIQSEKMASLGILVSGISHEINTPIGICVTSASYLKQEVDLLSERHHLGQLKKADFEEFISQMNTLATILSTNLSRADHLITSFKNISVDKTREEERLFNVRQYLEQVLMSLSPLIKNKGYKIEVECSDDILIYSYPGAIAQIITNMVTNSLSHGFENREVGCIRIKFERHGTHNRLTYSDDGIGIEPEIIKLIYDPFFTTKRGSRGGTGLGLHIVYNIVSQQLGGTIECRSSVQKGTTFVIQFESPMEG